MRESEHPTPNAAPRDDCVDPDGKAPLERLDQERLRAWRTDCRHHDDIAEVDETE
ncbi:MAG TPA: hypothetical protein PLL78_03495 [Fimbriimonadaceae bacterium]|nr:hypothetical protein [Fimbriimonadaceae bacterium]HRJ95725.1 hypothetical protein [Fimbriimonadaceae bacterium]